MFHPEKIAAKIRLIEQEKRINLRENSLADCIRIYDHFHSMEVMQGKKVVYCRDGSTPQQFQLSSDERQWIENEMYMCSCSFPYWFYRYFFIKTKEGDIRRPDRLIAQQIFLAILAELDILNLPILLLILKARQLGISTIIEAVILWIAIFVTGSHCVVASAEEDKSEQMSNMIWVGLEMLPLWMQPVMTREDRSIGPEFGYTHSDILIQHGSQTKGISRGDTPQAAHLSECSYYPDPIETIQSSLINAMHENPRTFLALESTARRKYDWWHNTWLKNRRGEATGYNRFVCLFLPWYVGRDKYPTEDWLRNHPMPDHWKIVSDGRNEPWRMIQGRVESGPMKETWKQAADAKLYVSTTELIKRHMPENWEMPPEQMWYWEFRYVESLDDDKEYKSFLAELAADERSCFQSKKTSVFSQAVLDNLENNQEKEYQVYALAGDGIDQRIHLRDLWDNRKRRVDISYQTVNGDYLHWKLIPLREEPEDDSMKVYLKIWEHPKPGYDYTIGVDIASGIGENNTVFFVLRKGKNNEPDVEVALFYSPWIPSPETPPIAMLLGVYYGQHMAPVPEALMAPEVQKAVGDFISHQLAKLGYSNFYYMERFDIRKHPGSRPSRRGWASTTWSQQMMKEAFEHGIKSGWIQVNSQELLDELDSLESEETESGRMVYDHAKDHTDDAYIAGGIAYFVAHGQETIMERMRDKTLKPAKKIKSSLPVQEAEHGASLLAKVFSREDRANYPSASETDDDMDARKFVF